MIIFKGCLLVIFQEVFSLNCFALIMVLDKLLLVERCQVAFPQCWNAWGRGFHGAISHPFGGFSLWLA